MRRIEFREEALYAGIHRVEHVITLAEPHRLMQEKDDGVDPLREIISLEPFIRLVDAVVPQHVMNVRLHACFEQYANRVVRVTAPIPAYRHSTAKLLAKSRDIRCHSVSARCEIRNKHVMLANLQNLLEMLVLVGVSPAAESKLVCAPEALFGNPLEIIHCHVRRILERPTLVTADSRFRT